MKLEVKEIRKSFGDTEILHGITFEVESGVALGLLGRNGAGKTTTIRILMDVFKANEGKILLDGAVFDRKEHQIGYLPEERGLYPKKTVQEQLIYLAMLRGMKKKEAAENTKKWLKRLEVDQYLNRKLETLSKGNQQKVQLASTLVCDPEIVILDEPFSGLDPFNVELFKEEIKRMSEAGSMIIFSSHRMEHVELFCKKLVIMLHGKPVIEGYLHDIKEQFRKKNIFIRAEMDVKLLKEIDGVISVEERPDEYEVKIRDNQVVDAVFKIVAKKAKNVTKFVVEEPTLNEIFVAKVGEEYDK